MIECWKPKRGRERVFVFESDGERSAPGVMAVACRSGDGERLSQSFAISVLLCSVIIINIILILVIIPLNRG